MANAEPSKKRRRRGFEPVDAPPGVPPPPPPSAMSSNIAPPDISRNSQAKLAAALSNISQKVSVKPVAPFGDVGAASIASTIPNITPIQEARIYVGSMAFDVTAEEVKRLFSPFGVVLKVDMSKDSTTGGSKGYCFVWFQDVQSAMAALQMDGFKLGDRNIKVGQPSDLAETKGGGEIASPLQTYAGVHNSTLVLLLGLHPALTCAMISTIAASFGRVLSCVDTQPAHPQHQQQQQQQQKLWTAQVQFESVKSAFSLLTAANLNGLVLAGNLVRVQSITEPVAPLPSTTSGITAGSSSGKSPAISAAMKCLVLHNMVSVEEVQSDPSLKQDIAREAANHGVLLSVDFAQRKQGDGESEAIVRLKYEDEKGAHNAWTVLNGRFFAGRQVVATLTE